MMSIKEIDFEVKQPWEDVNNGEEHHEEGAEEIGAGVRSRRHHGSQTAAGARRKHKVGRRWKGLIEQNADR